MVLELRIEGNGAVSGGAIADFGKAEGRQQQSPKEQACRQSGAERSQATESMLACAGKCSGAGLADA